MCAARSNPDSSPIVNRPYKQIFAYDAFGNRIGGEHKFWRTDYTPVVSRSFQNNRETTPSVNPITYDADGRPSGNRIDAAGKPVEYLSSESVGGYPTASPTERKGAGPVELTILELNSQISYIPSKRQPAFEVSSAESSGSTRDRTRAG